MKMSTIVSFLFTVITLCSVAASPGDCSERSAAESRQKAKKLDARNKFLNTKFPYSSAAPVFHYEKIRDLKNRDSK